MTREESLATIEEITKSVLKHFASECDKRGLRCAPMIVVPLLIAQSTLRAVVGRETERGEHTAGMAHAMLERIEPMTSDALNIAITIMQMRKPTEEELQDVAKQIQDMGRFKD